MSLRKISEFDLPLLRAWRNANAQYFPPGPEITAFMQREWYQDYLTRPEDHQYMVLADGRPVGSLAISVRTKIINRVMRGRPEGPGVMGHAVFELLDLYGEGTYMLQVLDGNDHAVKFYKRLGFRQSGWQEQRGTVMINMTMEHSK